MDGNDSDHSDIFFLKEEDFLKYLASVSHHSEITSCPQQSTEKEDNQVIILILQILLKV